MNVASENVTNETPQVKLPRRVKNLAGQKFGRLTVVRFVGLRFWGTAKNGASNWLCLCDCGAEINVTRCCLLTSNTRSCGCLNRDVHTTHGMTNSPEFTAWQAMRDRCYRSGNASFARYGKRGITVCERWRDSFDNFFADVGLRPSAHHSFGRIDNNGNYESKNCSWQLPDEQMNNRSNTKRYLYKGENLTLPQWARKLGVNTNTFISRLNKQGWTIERAVETPVKAAPKSDAVPA